MTNEEKAKKVVSATLILGDEIVNDDRYDDETAIRAIMALATFNLTADEASKALLFDILTKAHTH